MTISGDGGPVLDPNIAPMIPPAPVESPTQNGTVTVTSPSGSASPVPPPAPAPGSPRLSGSFGDMVVKSEAGDAAAKRARQCPARRIGADEVVEIAPANNTQGVQYSNDGPNRAVYGPCSIVAPNANPRTIKVNNLADIWFYPAVDGEGLVVRVY